MQYLNLMIDKLINLALFNGVFVNIGSLKRCYELINSIFVFLVLI